MIIVENVQCTFYPTDDKGHEHCSRCISDYFLLDKFQSIIGLCSENLLEIDLRSNIQSHIPTILSLSLFSALCIQLKIALPAHDGCWFIYCICEQRVPTRARTHANNIFINELMIC